MKAKRLVRIIIPLIVCLSAIADLARADIVHLKNGGVLEGEVRVDGDTVEIKRRGATITLDSSEVDFVEEKELPAEIYAAQLAGLDADDAEGHFELALWCKQKGLRQQYVELLETTVEIDPGHEEAAGLLYEYRKKRKSLPNNDEAAQKLLLEFGPQFEIKRTRHYRICYDASDVFVRQRARLFEQVYLHFFRFFEERGFQMELLDDHLEVILFESREEFVGYVRARDAILVNSAGFYSPADNRVYFYDSIAGANYQAAKEQIASVELRLRHLSEAVRRMRGGKVELRYNDGRKVTLTKAEALNKIRKDKSEVAAAQREIEEFYENENASTTIHEAVHQLAYNVGIQTRGVDSPKLVGEGLAMFFETARGGKWAGAGRMNRRRLDDYAAAASQGNLLSLSELLTQDDLYLSGGDRMVAAYSETWGIFYYLATEHEGQLMKYLTHLREQPVGKRLLPTERINDFQKFFGSIYQLEDEWKEFMNTLVLE